MSTSQTPSNEQTLAPDEPAPNILTVDESFREADLNEVLDDLSSRFILNMPEPELSSTERISFQIEQAHWYYEDFVRPLNPNFPSLNLRRFSALLFKACPLLNEFSHEQAFEDFQRYKSRVPVCGAIMMNAKMDKCVLVKGWKSTSAWSFPKGKINQDESRAACAVREVREETGYDFGAAGLLDKSAKSEMEINQQSLTLFFVVGVPEDTVFETQTRKEISKIEWFRLSDLPTWSKKRATKENGKFYLISPFVSALRAFVLSRRPPSPTSTPLDRQRKKSAAPNGYQPQILQAPHAPAGPRSRDVPPHQQPSSSSQSLEHSGNMQSYNSVSLSSRTPLDPTPGDSRAHPDGHMLGESDRSSSPGPVTPPADALLNQQGRSTEQAQHAFSPSKAGSLAASEPNGMSNLSPMFSAAPTAEPPIPSQGTQRPPLPSNERVAKQLALLQSLVEPLSGSQGVSGSPLPQAFSGQPQGAPRLPTAPIDPRMTYPVGANRDAPFLNLGSPMPPQPLPQQQMPVLRNPQATYPYYPPAAFPNGRFMHRDDAAHKGALLSMLSARPSGNERPEQPQTLYQSTGPLLQNATRAEAFESDHRMGRPVSVPMQPQPWMNPHIDMTQPRMNGLAGYQPSPPNIMPVNHSANSIAIPSPSFGHRRDEQPGSMDMARNAQQPGATLPVRRPDVVPNVRANQDFPYSGPSPGVPLTGFFPKGLPLSARQPQPLQGMPNMPFPNGMNPNYPAAGPAPQVHGFVPSFDPSRARHPEQQHLLSILNSGPRPPSEQQHLLSILNSGARPPSEQQHLLSILNSGPRPPLA